MGPPDAPLPIHEVDGVSTAIKEGMAHENALN